MSKPLPNERLFYLLTVLLLAVSMTGCAASKKAVRQEKKPAREVDHDEQARLFAESYARSFKPQTQPKEPKATQENKPTKIADATWNSIRQRKIDASKPVTLAELVDIALRNSPSTRQAWYNAALELAKEKQEAAALYPSIEASSVLTKQRQTANIATKKLDQKQYSAGLDLTYLLLDLGGRSASIEETKQKLAAANLQYNQAVQDLVLAVEEAYYNFYSAQSAQDAAESNVATSRKDFDAAKARFDAGVAVKLDVLQSQSDYEDALYSLEVAKGQVKNSRALLAQALGLAADTEFQIALPSKELPQWLMSDDVSALIDKAVVQRRDVAASRANLASKKAAVRAANSDLWPSLNFGSTLGRDWYDMRVGAPQKAKDYNYSGSLQLKWYVFDGFYLLNKKREAQAEMDVAMEELIDTEIQASTDVWIKYQDYKSAVSKLEFSKSLFDTATASYELAFAGYKAGIGSILDLLQAQNNFSDAASKLIQSKQDVFVAFAQLAHATGTISAPAREDNARGMINTAREQ